MICKKKETDQNASYEYYFRYNKLFLSIIGLWPYQSFVSRLLFSFIASLASFSQVCVQTGGMIAAKLNNDKQVFIASVAPVMVNGIVLPKFINFFFNGKKLYMLLRQVEDDWRTFENSKDIRTVRDYAIKTYKFCPSYAGAVYGGMAPVLFLPAIPAILEACGVIKQEEKLLPYPVQYFVNVDKYYYFLIIDSFVGTGFMVMMVVSVDAMFVLFLNHACSLCSIVGTRMQDIVQEMQFENNVPRNDLSYRRLASCIKLHSRMVRFVDYLENCMTTSFLVIIGFNVAGVTFTGFQAVILKSDPAEAFPYLTFTFAQLSHLYVLCSKSQLIFDHSTKLHTEGYNGLWYHATNRTRKLLTMFLMRSLKPCEITAGKYFVLNIVYFSNVLRTCMSYFTVLSQSLED